MRIVNVFLVGVGLLVGCGVGDSSLVVAPKNTAAISGKLMFLQCSTTGNESSVRQWYVKRVLDQSGRLAESQLIFGHWKNNDPYTISADFSHFNATLDASGSVVLYTNSSKIEDAGLYECVVEVQKEITRYSAHVTILHNTPDCVANFKSDDFLRNGDQLWMRCSVSYRGSLAPVLQWRKHYRHGDTETAGKVVTEGIQANTVSDSNINSTLTISASLSSDDVYYTCTVSFPSYNSNDSKIAGNAPEFNYTWESPVVRGQSPTTERTSSLTVEPDSGVATQPNEPTNWFMISLALGAGMLGVFVLMAVTTSALYCRMKRRTLQVETRTTSEVGSRPEELQDKLTSKEAEAQLSDEGYDVILNDCYERIGDVIGDGDASTDNRWSVQSRPGYANLLRPFQRQSSSFLQVYHQDKPVKYKEDMTGPAEQDHSVYLTIEDTVSPCPSGTEPSYLALVRDSVEVSNSGNRSSEYLKPYVDIQKKGSQETIPETQDLTESIIIG